MRNSHLMLGVFPDLAEYAYASCRTSLLEYVASPYLLRVPTWRTLGETIVD